MDKPENLKPNIIRIFGTGSCACGAGPDEFVLLGVRGAPLRTVMYCPSCGSSWDRPEDVESVNPRSLREIAPEGVRYPTDEEIRVIGAADITHSGWAPVIAELMREQDK